MTLAALTLKAVAIHTSMRNHFLKWRRAPPLRVGYSLNECGPLTNAMASGDDIVIKDIGETMSEPKKRSGPTVRINPKTRASFIERERIRAEQREEAAKPKPGTYIGLNNVTLAGRKYTDG